MKKEEGITLVALVVTIIVLLILASVTITGAIKGVDESQENKLLSELGMIQHAIVERDTKYKLTKDSSTLVGTKVTTSQIDVSGLETGSITWKYTLNDGDDYKSYYRVNENDLKNLGLEVGTGSYKDTYIVNYYTHEVYNESTKKTPNNKLLYGSFE